MQCNVSYLVIGKLRVRIWLQLNCNACSDIKGQGTFAFDSFEHGARRDGSPVNALHHTFKVHGNEKVFTRQINSVAVAYSSHDLQRKIDRTVASGLPQLGKISRSYKIRVRTYEGAYVASLIIIERDGKLPFKRIA